MPIAFPSKFAKEGVAVGRLLTSYSILEIDLMNCVQMGRGGDLNCSRQCTVSVEQMLASMKQRNLESLVTALWDSREILAPPYRRSVIV
jgi:hypothetical protein